MRERGGFHFIPARLYVIFPVGVVAVPKWAAVMVSHFQVDSLLFIQKEDKLVGSQETSGSQCLGSYQLPYQDFNSVLCLPRQIVDIARVSTSPLTTVFETFVLILTFSFEVTLVNASSLRDDFLEF